MKIRTRTIGPARNQAGNLKTPSTNENKTQETKTHGIQHKQDRKDADDNHVHIRKEERSQVNNLTLHLNELKREGKAKSGVGRTQELKMRSKINKRENRL